MEFIFFVPQKCAKFIVILFLLSFSFIAHAENLLFDPCKFIWGTWHGTWRFFDNDHDQKCLWEATAHAARHHDLVRLEVMLANGKSTNGTICRPSNFTLSGTCKDAVVLLNYNNVPIKGTMFGSIIDFNGANFWATFKKK